MRRVFQNLNWLFIHRSNQERRSQLVDLFLFSTDENLRVKIELKGSWYAEHFIMPDSMAEDPTGVYDHMPVLGCRMIDMFNFVEDVDIKTVKKWSVFFVCSRQDLPGREPPLVWTENQEQLLCWAERKADWENNWLARSVVNRGCLFDADYGFHQSFDTKINLYAY